MTYSEKFKSQVNKMTVLGLLLLAIGGSGPAMIYLLNPDYILIAGGIYFAMLLIILFTLFFYRNALNCPNCRKDLSNMPHLISVEFCPYCKEDFKVEMETKGVCSNSD